MTRSEILQYAAAVYDAAVENVFEPAKVRAPELMFDVVDFSAYNHEEHKLNISPKELLLRFDNVTPDMVRHAVLHELGHAYHAEWLKKRNLAWHEYGKKHNVKQLFGQTFWKGRPMNTQEQYVRVPAERIANWLARKWSRRLGYGDLTFNVYGRVKDEYGRLV